MRQTDFLILGLLAERPLSGYQIKKIVDIRFRFFWSESFGQIFPALKALAAAGLVQETEEQTENGRAAKTYEITPAGRSSLQEWLRRPVEKESYRLEILLKTYFSVYTEPAVMLAHLDTFYEGHARELAILDRFQAELEGMLDEDENHREILRVIDCGQRLNRAYLGWCRETRAYYEKKQEQKQTGVPAERPASAERTE